VVKTADTLGFPFCNGLRKAVRFGSISKLLIAWVTAAEKMESLS
jgi:hypothetical protein